MLIRDLRKSSEVNKETEREIVFELISRGEDVDLIRDICSDPSLELDNRKVGRLLHNYSVLYQDKNFIYVPSIHLYVAKHIIVFDKNWSKCHDIFKRNKSRMPTISEFIEFLKYLRDSDNPEYKQIYNEITKTGLQRQEFLDAYFEKRKDGWYILTQNKTKAEKLDEETLMKERTPGISLDNYLNSSHTSQGLPAKKCRRGNFYYYPPDKEKTNSIASFDTNYFFTDLACCGIPESRDSILGARAVRDI